MPQAAPRTADDLLGVLDAEVSDNPGFGAWVQDKVSPTVGSVPAIHFPKVIEKWERHHEEFDFEDPMEYWRKAVEIVERGRGSEPNRPERCFRSDGVEIFWDGELQAIVFVLEDGSIETFYKPDDGREYFEGQCAR